MREKGDTTVSNLSNIHFFIITIFTFSPPSTLVAGSACDGEIIVAPIFYPSRHRLQYINGPNSHRRRRRRCVISRFSFRPKLDYYIFPISFRHGLDLPGFCDFFFLFIALVEIRIKQAQRPRTARRCDGQLQRHFPVCRNTLHPIHGTLRQ